jgi:hypothetical protein
LKLIARQPAKVALLHMDVSRGDFRWSRMLRAQEQPFAGGTKTTV